MDSPELPLVTAVMPTSGNPTRRRLAKLAIESFRQQSYANRRLLILNHGEVPFNLPDENIAEAMVTRPATLGELRNIAFEFITEGYVTTWDDDDWHARPRMAYQLAQLQGYQKQAAILTSYTTLDLATGEAFVRSCKAFSCGGCCGTIMFSAQEAARYTALDRKEDTLFALHFAAKQELHLAENSPLLYIRTCHSDNTSGREHVMNVKPTQRRELLGEERHLLEQMLETFVAIGAIDPLKLKSPSERRPHAG
jgi:hypothetical protein